jgi:hypothetical protein
MSILYSTFMLQFPPFVRAVSCPQIAAKNPVTKSVLLAEHPYRCNPFPFFHFPFSLLCSLASVLTLPLSFLELLSSLCSRFTILRRHPSRTALFCEASLWR